MRNFPLLFLAVLLFSCTGKNDIPKRILKPDKMQDVFWDYIRADIYATDYIKKDSSKNSSIENLRLQDKVFKLHHTSREAFYESYTWYSNHRALMKVMLDSMIARKEREKTRVKPLLKSL
jgi:Domain of unknown function (DUF4296)